MMQINVQDFIDTERYPIDETDSSRYHTLMTDIQTQLKEVGCAVLSGFIKPDGVTQLIAEADQLAAKGHRSFNRTNVYFSKDDESLTLEHPIRRFYDRSNAFVPADNFGKNSPLRNIYEWPVFMSFIQHSLNEKDFYRYADPLADVIINVVEEGDGFPWHFDTNNYTVTLAIQNGDEGGLFEYSPNLRTTSDENYPGVQSILDGNTDTVHTLELMPGDLQIFKGRYSLHRVSPVKGLKRRYVGIFSFVDQPSMVAKVERAKQLYGRALPIHYELENKRSDALKD